MKTSVNKSFIMQASCSSFVRNSKLSSLRM